MKDISVSKDFVQCRTVDELLEFKRQHRLRKHGTDDQDIFFDCAMCGVIDSRIRRWQTLNVQ